MSRLIEVIPIRTESINREEEIEAELNRIVKNGTHRLISLTKTSFSDKFLAVFEVEE